MDSKMRHIKKFENIDFGSKKDAIISSIIEWINPEFLEDSQECILREYGDDSDVFKSWHGNWAGDPKPSDQVETIKEVIFDDETHKKSKLEESVQSPLFKKIASVLGEDWEVSYYNGSMHMQYKLLSMGHDKMAVSGRVDGRGEMEIWEEDDMREIQYFFRGKVTESTIETILRAIDIYQYVDRFTLESLDNDNVEVSEDISVYKCVLMNDLFIGLKFLTAFGFERFITTFKKRMSYYKSSEFESISNSLLKEFKDNFNKMSYFHGNMGWDDFIKEGHLDNLESDIREIKLKIKDIDYVVENR